MTPLLLTNLEAIRALFHEYGVVRLEVFGSAATGECELALVSVDFIVELPPSYDFGPVSTRYIEPSNTWKGCAGGR